MDGAPDYGSGGWEFESLQRYITRPVGATDSMERFGRSDIGSNPIQGTFVNNFIKKLELLFGLCIFISTYNVLKFKL